MGNSPMSFNAIFEYAKIEYSKQHKRVPAIAEVLVALPVWHIVGVQTAN